MLLGELIARCSDETIAEEIVLSIGDLATLAALRDQSEATGVGLGACIAAATRRYAAEASDEEWVTLIGQMGGAQDPAKILLKRALAYASAPLDQQECGHVSHG
jgi:hypothetical protein